MYIMCVCLFSALSRRVGALQISIIIIICNLMKEEGLHWLQVFYLQVVLSPFFHQSASAPYPPVF